MTPRWTEEEENLMIDREREQKAEQAESDSAAAIASLDDETHSVPEPTPNSDADPEYATDAEAFEMLKAHAARLGLVTIEDAYDPCPFKRMPCGKHLCDTPMKCPNAYTPPCETGLPPLTDHEKLMTFV
jgi:hypothetical protein